MPQALLTSPQDEQKLLSAPQPHTVADQIAEAAADQATQEQWDRFSPINHSGPEVKGQTDADRLTPAQLGKGVVGAMFGEQRPTREAPTLAGGPLRRSS